LPASRPTGLPVCLPACLPACDPSISETKLNVNIYFCNKFVYRLIYMYGIDRRSGAGAAKRPRDRAEAHRPSLLAGRERAARGLHFMEGHHIHVHGETGQVRQRA
jgi:hypothetical protein